MYRQITDEVLDTSGQLDESPRYRIRDNNGDIISDNVQLEMKTPVLNQGTPLNRATFSELQGDIYTSNQYNTCTLSDGEAVSYTSDYWYNFGYDYYNIVGDYTSSGDYHFENLLKNNTDKYTELEPVNSVSTIVIRNKHKIAIKTMYIKGRYATSDNSNPKNFAISGSNDGVTWYDLYANNTEIMNTLTVLNINSNQFYQFIKFEFTSTYSSIWIDRLYIANCQYKSSLFNIGNLPLTSYETNKIIKIKTPQLQATPRIITGNILPISWTSIVTGTSYSSYGFKLTASSSYSSSYYPASAVDSSTSSAWKPNTSGEQWLKLEFPNAIKILSMILYATGGNGSTFYIQGSNNNSAWTNVFTKTVNYTKNTVVYLNNTQEYKYYRLYCSSTTTDMIVYNWGVNTYEVNEYPKFYSPLVNINSLGAKLISTELEPNTEYSLKYNGSYFVEDNSQYVVGTYTGNSASYQTINLGFKPKVVYVNDHAGFHSATDNVTGGLVIPGGKLYRSDSYDVNAIEIIDNGFIVAYSPNAYIHTNDMNTVYYYMALK